MRALAYRVCITLINIFFPPLAVMMLCGAHWDCMLNCFLFLLAVIPSHVHGFYISCTYFHRRHKVKKGRYPGGPKSLIHSRNVINGGASDAEVERLYRQEKGLKRRSSRAGSHSSESNPSREYRPSGLEKQYGSQASMQMTSAGRVGSGRTGTADARAGAYAPGARESSTRRWAEGVARDGYGVPGTGRRGGYEELSRSDGSRTGRSGWRG